MFRRAGQQTHYFVTPVSERRCMYFWSLAQQAMLGLSF
jgi:hypothetical protein